MKKEDIDPEDMGWEAARWLAAEWHARPPINSRWRGWRLLALMSWDATWHRHGAGALPPATQAPATRG